MQPFIYVSGLWVNVCVNAPIIQYLQRFHCCGTGGRRQHSADHRDDDDDDDDRNRFIYLNTAILHDRNRFIYLNTAILSLSTLFSTKTDQPIIVNLGRAVSETAQTWLWSLWCQRRCQYRVQQLAVPGTERPSSSVCPLSVPPGTWTEITADVIVPTDRPSFSVCPLSVPPGTWTEITADVIVPTDRPSFSVCPLYVPPGTLTQTIADVPTDRPSFSVCPLYVPPGTWAEITADVPTARSGMSVSPLYVPADGVRYFDDWQRGTLSDAN